MEGGRADGREGGMEGRRDGGMEGWKDGEWVGGREGRKGFSISLQFLLLEMLLPWQPMKACVAFGCCICCAQDCKFLPAQSLSLCSHSYVHPTPLFSGSVPCARLTTTPCSARAIPASQPSRRYVRAGGQVVGAGAALSWHGGRS